MVWSQYRLSGAFYVPIILVWFCLPRCVFHTNAVFKSCTFYTGSIVALLDLFFKLQYLMNYSSDFINFCRFQLIASSLYYTTVVIRRPEFWGPNFYSLFFKVYAVFHENIIKNDTDQKNYNTTMSQSYSTYFIMINVSFTK